MIHADKRMNPKHFDIDPADIRIWIQINPEIWIRLPDQILALAEFALSKCSCLDCRHLVSNKMWWTTIFITRKSFIDGSYDRVYWVCRAVGIKCLLLYHEIKCANAIGPHTASRGKHHKINWWVDHAYECTNVACCTRWQSDGFPPNINSTFSALGVSHVVRYINARYLLTYEA